jgi:hypothetical protein
MDRTELVEVLTRLVRGLLEEEEADPEEWAHRLFGNVQEALSLGEEYFQQSDHCLGHGDVDLSKRWYSAVSTGGHAAPSGFVFIMDAEMTPVALVPAELALSLTTILNHAAAPPKHAYVYDGKGARQQLSPLLSNLLYARIKKDRSRAKTDDVIAHGLGLLKRDESFSEALDADGHSPPTMKEVLEGLGLDPDLLEGDTRYATVGAALAESVYGRKGFFEQMMADTYGARPNHAVDETDQCASWCEACRLEREDRKKLTEADEKYLSMVHEVQRKWMEAFPEVGLYQDYVSYVTENLERIDRDGWVPISFAEFRESEEAETTKQLREDVSLLSAVRMRDAFYAGAQTFMSNDKIARPFQEKALPEAYEAWVKEYT